MKRIIQIILLFNILIPANAQPPAIPSITQFSPLNGAVGATVTILGDYFDTKSSNNLVYFGATKATSVTATFNSKSYATELIVKVPKGATCDRITVINISLGKLAYSRSFFNPVFSPNKGAITPADFSSRSGGCGTDLTPEAILTGDLDQDGLPDLISANFTDNNISIARNYGMPDLFPFREQFITGSSPYSIAIGDLNGDGKLDLATANSASNSVSVLINTSTSGKISFAAKVDLQAGKNPVSIAIGDIDLDGISEIIVANKGSNSISVFRNTSNKNSITFATKVDFTTGAEPMSVMIFPFKSGMPELVVANSAGNSISILQNTSCGSCSKNQISFAAKIDYSLGFQPWALAVGDLDNDNYPELAAASLSDNSITILSGYDYSFAKTKTFKTNSIPQRLAIGDLNGDGYSDLIVSENSNTTTHVSLFRNKGKIATISFDTSIVVGKSASYLVYGSLCIGDFDGDGINDIAASNRGYSGINIIFNDPQFVTYLGKPLTEFTTCFGTASDYQILNIRANSLIGDLNLTVSDGFELSTSLGLGFGNSVSLKPNAGKIDSASVFVRLSKTAVENNGWNTNYGELVLTTPGIRPNTINLTGEIKATSNIVGLTNVGLMDTISYSVEGSLGSSFKWIIGSANFASDPDSNSVQIVWTNSGIDTIRVTETTTEGCVGIQKTIAVNVSSSVNLNDFRSNKYFSIFPNPVHETLFIKIHDIEELKKVTLNDLLGEEIIITTNKELDLSYLIPGVYILQIKDVQGGTYSFKVVKY